MLQSMLLVVVTAVATWFFMRWVRSSPPRPEPLTSQEREISRAKDVGTQLDSARDRSTSIEAERNRLALAKAVKAAVWVTESRLNVAVPELLKTAQLWIGQSQGAKWKPPDGVTDVQGMDDVRSPWAAWTFGDHRWRIEGEWRPSILPEEIEEDIGTCRVRLDEEIVLDMTVSSKDFQVMWIDALTVGPWVSDLLEFAGAQKSDAQARSNDVSARKHQQRADNIHWS